MNKISVLLVDDHAVVRTGYKTYLGLSDRIGDIFECNRGESAFLIYEQHHPDVVVLDLSMPGLGGLETLRRLLGKDPDCKILVFSMHDEIIFISRALQAGAKGYIVKSSAPETLVNAVCTIANGGNFLMPELSQKLALDLISEETENHKIKQLSPREFDIFCHLANGLTTREAAEKLCLGYKTVCNHSTAIREKLGIKSFAELTLMATRLGLIKTSP